MLKGQLTLLLVFSLGLLTKNNILNSAAGILIVMQAMGFERLFPLLENRSLDFGLLFLTLAILVPLASGRINLSSILLSLWSPVGLVTILGGIAGAVLNARGVDLLLNEPSIIGGIIFGSLLGILFFGGIPVGPVMAAGLSSVLLKIWRHYF